MTSAGAATGGKTAVLPPVWDVPGQRRAAEVLRGAVERGEVAHAWAFVGPPGVGQERLTRVLAAALNCTDQGRTDADPCGRCSVCDRCLRGTHPAYTELTREGVNHLVKAVRERWLPAAYRTLPEGRVKVLRIVDADRMNEQAANAFLKGLEEPPERTVWTLDVAEPDELPDTILSRCRVVRVAGWRRAALHEEAARLRLDDPGDRELAVRLAMGSPVRLVELADGGLDDVRRHRALLADLREQGPGYAVVFARALDDEVKRRSAGAKAETKQVLAELAESYGGEPPRAVVKEVEEHGDRRAREARLRVVQAALDDVVGWIRDCLVVDAGGGVDEVLHVDAVDALRDDAEALGRDLLLRAAERVLDARDPFEVNVQQALAIEALALELSTLHMLREQ